MKTTLQILILCVSVCFKNILVAQGCSDAGVCTAASFKPVYTFDNKNDSVLQKSNKNQIIIGGGMGFADYDIYIQTGNVEYSRIINKKISADFKITYLSQIGNGYENAGLGDIFLSFNYQVKEKLKFTLGSKIPLNMSDRKDPLPLPMDYQTSLGTFDLIAGIGYEVKKIRLVAAVQYPLTQNKNTFLAENYSSDSELINFQIVFLSKN